MLINLKSPQIFGNIPSELSLNIFTSQYIGFNPILCVNIFVTMLCGHSLLLFGRTPQKNILSSSSSSHDHHHITTATVIIIIVSPACKVNLVFFSRELNAYKMLVTCVWLYEYDYDSHLLWKYTFNFDSFPQATIYVVHSPQICREEKNGSKWVNDKHVKCTNMKYTHTLLKV